MSPGRSAHAISKAASSTGARREAKSPRNRRGPQPAGSPGSGRLIRRFVDPDADFLYVPTAEVRKTAEEKTAVPYDIPEVEFAHDGELCSFDAFLRKFHLEKDPALADLALIVRGADTNRLDLAPQAAGLLAVSLGLSRLHKDDQEMLEHGIVVYDALYAWCKEGKNEIHTWNPALYK
jgi:hypothetical protein